MRKIFIYILFLLSFSVVEAAGCDALLTRDAAEFIADIVTIARIAVPILLIVLCSSDFVAIVTGQDEKVTKTSISRIVKRFIAAAAFFFVPLIIQLILGIDAVNNALNLVDDPSCGIDGDLSGYKTEEEIQKETEERLEEERKKKEEEEKKKKEQEIENQYKDEEFHKSSITGVRYITFNQIDPRWKDIPYGSGSTVGAEGCPVIASSVIISAHNSKITPADVVKTNPHTYPHTSVEAYAKDSFDCSMSRPSKYKDMREFLKAGNVAVIRIQGPNAGGSNKFVPGNHYMALIDYNEKKDMIFVGNAFGTRGYAKSGWFDASTVLTSIKHGHYCTIKQSLIDKHNGKYKAEEEEEKSNIGTKTIYIGDSRTIGMCAAVTGSYNNCTFNGTPYKYSNTDIFIAKGSMGYTWFNDEAVPAVNKLLASDPNTTYNIVSYMGVNWLLSDISKYEAKYAELAKGAWKKHNIILVSVNPVDEAKEAQNKYYVKQKNIIEFNNRLKAVATPLSNVSYCDTYNKIINNFGTSDGLHYTTATSKDIYNHTNTCIKNS